MKKQKNTPPIVSGGIPGLGHALEFQKDRISVLWQGYKEHGAIFAVNLGVTKVAVLVGAEYHKMFFAETDKRFNIGKAYSFAKAMFGEIGFTASQEAYNNQRPLLYEPFGRKKMLSHLKFMQLEIQAWLDSLGDEGVFEIQKEMINLTQNVAGHTLFGKDFQNIVGEEFWQCYEDIGKSLDVILDPNLPLPKFIKRDKAKKRLLEIMQPVIAERRQKKEGYNDFLQDFIDKKLADGTKADDKTVLGFLLALMFAGHETTAQQSLWAILLLLKNPDYLATVTDEIQAKLSYGMQIDPYTLSTLEKTFYAVEESVRMKPAVNVIPRIVDEDVEIGGYVIPKGWSVFVTGEIAHFLPEFFEEPETYNPLRYAEPNNEKEQHRFSMIGFGGGLHKCAGMNFAYNEMTLILALLFQQFDLELLTKETKVISGLGANRATPTEIRYKRKKISELVSDDTLKEAVSAGCPHLSKMAKAEGVSSNK